MHTLHKYVHIIYLDVTLVGGGDKKRGVEGEAEPPDRHRVPLERVNKLLGGDVKYIDDAVDGSARDVLAVPTLKRVKHSLTITSQSLNIHLTSTYHSFNINLTSTYHSLNIHLPFT